MHPSNDCRNTTGSHPLSQSSERYLLVVTSRLLFFRKLRSCQPLPVATRVALSAANNCKNHYICAREELILLSSAAAQVRPIICMSPSGPHAFPSHSFWVLFLTGACMVPYSSSSVSIISLKPDQRSYIFYHEKMCTATISPRTIGTSSNWAREILTSFSRAPR